MKKGLKALLLVMCAIVLVVATVFTTLAYMTSKQSIENTFTIGNLAITLDETKVDLNGVAVTGEGEGRFPSGNQYKLVPGHEYLKDPQIHVQPNSEASWVFVKVENGISAIEAAGNTTIEAQILANGWTALPNETGVYYKQQAAVGNTAVDLDVFETFTLANNANVTNSYSTAKVIVTGYAIQQDGFTDVALAWEALEAAYPAQQA